MALRFVPTLFTPAAQLMQLEKRLQAMNTAAA
jgi:hypothetical protein